MQKKLIIICLINFFIAALMGLALRYSFINSININYRFLTHAHSHVAMLGWIYLMLYVSIVYYFIPEKKSIYNRLFWLTEFSVIGMMVSFPIQGYAVVSISFSTLHILCSYYFVYLVWKNSKTKTLATRYLLRSSLLFMLLSTVGVWCLGPAVSMLGQASTLYQIAIQFFLHFQFNGWFLIAVIAVLFHILNIENSKQFKLFFKLLIISTLLTLALPIQWFAPNKLLLWINGFGVILQLLALYLFIKIIKHKIQKASKQHSNLQIYLFNFSAFCLILKVAIQFVSILPEFAQVVYEHRNFVIGFIHLLMLGVISGFLFSFILKSDLVRFSRTLYLGIISFFLGFVLTELLLLIQGYKYYFSSGKVPNYYLLLFLFSILLPLGIFLIAFNILRHKTPKRHIV